MIMKMNSTVRVSEAIHHLRETISSIADLPGKWEIRGATTSIRCRSQWLLLLLPTLAVGGPACWPVKISTSMREPLSESTPLSAISPDCVAMRSLAPQTVPEKVPADAPRDSGEPNTLGSASPPAATPKPALDKPTAPSDDLGQKLEITIRQLDLQQELERRLLRRDQR